VSRSSHVALTYNLSKVIPAHLYALLLAIHADTGISLFFAMSILFNNLLTYLI